MKIHWPKITIPEGFENVESYLRHLVYEGAKKRYVVDMDIIERIEHEFDCLKGFEPYFVMFYDLVNFCHKEKIVVGAGYGNAASSIINYSLGITSVDPIRWKLTFESFFLKGTSYFPDIDINVDKTKVDDIFRYLQNTYGEDCVLNAGVCHRFILEKKRSERVPVYAIRSCGICIFDEPYDNIVKTIEVNNRETGIKKRVPVMTKEELETIGYINIDIMGTEKMSYVGKTLDLIERTKGEHIDYDSIPLNDEDTFAFLSSGHEDVGEIWIGGKELTDTFYRLKPSNWQDLCNLHALFTRELYKYKDYYYRAMEMGDVESEYGFAYADYCKPTRGLLLYQEQITEVLHTMSNLDIALCEKIRRYMKYPDYLPIREIFMKGVQGYGIYDDEQAANMWYYLLINKNSIRSYSHEISYAIMWYRATWLRVHYPEEFKECYPLD